MSVSWQELCRTAAFQIAAELLLRAAPGCLGRWVLALGLPCAVGPITCAQLQGWVADQWEHTVFSSAKADMLRNMCGYGVGGGHFPHLQGCCFFCSCS